MRQRDRETADSWYEATREYRVDAPRPEGDLAADVVVIGGGLTGSAAALCLAEKGVSVTLLESRHYGWGASGRSGGQIIAGYSCDPRVLEKLVGQDTARELWDHSLAALDFTRDRIRRHDIRCDLTQGYYHVGVKPRHARELAEWAEHLDKVYGYGVLEYHEGAAARAMVNSPLYSAVVSDPGSGHLHPLNYSVGLSLAAQAAGAKLYQDAHVEAVHSRGGEYEVQLAGAKIRCGQVIYGCNAYIGDLQRDLRRTIMPVGTCIIATEPLGERVAESLIAGNAAVSDTSHVLDYYRLTRDHRLLFGGRVTTRGLEPKRVAVSLAGRLARAFPQIAGAPVAHAWGGYVAITRNRAPHIGQLADGGYYAQGFSGQGMALAGYAGSLLADAVTGDTSRLDCFRRIPHRPFPGGSALHTPSLMAAMAWHRLLDCR